MGTGWQWGGGSTWNTLPLLDQALLTLSFPSRTTEPLWPTQGLPEPHLTKGIFHMHPWDLLVTSPNQSALGGTLGPHKWAAELLHKGQI